VDRRPATEHRDIFTLSLDNILSATVALLKKAVFSRHNATAEFDASSPEPAGRQRRSPSSRTMVQVGIAAVTYKAIRFLKSIVTGGRTWTVGWRPASSRNLLRDGKATFRPLRDDGARYYADPFPFRWNSRTFLFVEEYPYATGRGRIAVSEIDADGRASVPRPALEEPYHLSYPYVFEHDGQIWMIPESGAADGVYLYRSVTFPCVWKREACLIQGCQLYDASLVFHRGRHWMFASMRAWNSTSWDMLALFNSDELGGNWQPHRHNPVIIEASSSRPAGAAFEWRGDLLRPAQDCSEGYGGAINLCRIDTLDHDVFMQTVVGRLHCGLYGTHTYNFEAIEVVDAFARRGLDGINAFYEPVPTRAVALSGLRGSGNYCHMER